MPRAAVNGVELFYQVTGDGAPLVFCHEFAGDYRSWGPQVRALSRLYRCITYCHRGFPPSSVPTDPEAYSQDLLVADLLGLLDHLGIQRAHLVGFSMGGNVVLNFALRHPERCHGIVVVGTGSGSTNRERFLSDVDRTVELLRSRGIAGFAEVYTRGPTRLPFLRKDPHGWAEFRANLEDHSAEGQALTMLGVMVRRPTIFALEPQLERLTVPTLVMTGDEDEPCLEPALFMKRKIAPSGLIVVPQTGHAVNLEEPAQFNRAVLDFLHLVEANRWAAHRPPGAGLLPPP
jgi:pimeloyl-ACP methyl ester carboxylesterase